MKNENFTDCKPGTKTGFRTRFHRAGAGSHGCLIPPVGNRRATALPMRATKRTRELLTRRRAQIERWERARAGGDRHPLGGNRNHDARKQHGGYEHKHANQNALRQWIRVRNRGRGRARKQLRGVIRSNLCRTKFNPRSGIRAVPTHLGLDEKNRGQQAQYCAHSRQPVTPSRTPILHATSLPSALS